MVRSDSESAILIAAVLTVIGSIVRKLPDLGRHGVVPLFIIIVIVVGSSPTWVMAFLIIATVLVVIGRMVRKPLDVMFTISVPRSHAHCNITMLHHRCCIGLIVIYMTMTWSSSPPYIAIRSSLTWDVIGITSVIMVILVLAPCLRRPRAHGIYDPDFRYGLDILPTFRFEVSRQIDSMPSYWSRNSIPDHPPFSFHAVIRSPHVMDVAYELLNGTACGVVTSDRSGAPPNYFDIVTVQRIEDSALWAAYAAKCKTIQNRGVKRKIAVKTTPLLPADVRKTLCRDINEVYLFHGTSPDALEGISRTGFRIDLAGTATGLGFGRGAYFAERSTKSDEYSTSRQVQVGLVEEDHFRMLLCRVCLGEVYRITDFDVAAERYVVGSSRYDSLLGDREKAKGTFREFVVYDKDQIYPEYAIIYKRSDTKPPKLRV